MYLIYKSLRMDHASPRIHSTMSDETGRTSQQTDVSEDYRDVVVVDWDGPDDPENPRKYARLVEVMEWALILRTQLAVPEEMARDDGGVVVHIREYGYVVGNRAWKREDC